MRIGDSVHHSRFGKGNIAARDGDKVRVDFEVGGLRTVIAAFLHSSPVERVVPIRPGLVQPPSSAAQRPVVRATPHSWRDPTQIPPRKWIYGRHMIRQFLSATVAPGGVGKSTLAIVDALALATGRNLLGDQPNGRFRVWYWNLEDPQEEIDRRIAAACLHYEIGPDDLAGQLFVNSGRDTSLVIVESSPGGGMTMATPVLAALEQQIQEHEIDVLILDPFVSTHRVNENDNTQVNAVVQLWSLLADRTKIAIEAVHHVRKGQSGGDGYSVEDGRGASAFLAAVRSARVLNAMSKEEAARFDIQSRRAFFRVDNGKANLAPPPEIADWRQLVSVDLGNGYTNGKNAFDVTIGPSDHVAVAASWEPPKPLDGLTVNDLRKAQLAVNAGGPWRESPLSPDWVGYPVGKALGLGGSGGQLKPHEKAKIKGALAIWTGNEMFEVYEDTDEKRKPRKFVRVGKPASD